MGTTDAAHVDVAAVHAVAREYEAASSLIDAALRNHMSALTFGGATAGQAYAAHGDALRDALHGLTVGLREWSRAAAEIAAVLHAGADRYRHADLAARERLG
ncbi:type VII secretion target [Mycobacterium sp. pV006]|uniref:type VII secretion target n=1 Tax=Mycobacterium sp. pV006 TaxID=3238983 RepID=UPI00351B3E7E